jgi:hypothetical protein
MTKDDTTGNGATAGESTAVHLVLQGKGGIGKSVVTSWQDEFLIKRGEPVCCIDAAPVNR